MDESGAPRGPTRRFLLRLGGALIVTLVVLQTANWFATADAVRSAVVDEEIEGWDSFVDLVALVGASGDRESFAASIQSMIELDPATDVEAEAEATDLDFSWHTSDDDAVIAGDPVRTDLVDEVLAAGGRQTRVSGNRLEYVRAIPVTDGRVVVRADFELVAVERVTDQLRDRFLLFGALAGVLAIAVFALAGGRAVVRAHREAVRLGYRDALTGLGNHRAFLDELPRAIARADRSGRPLALVVADVDAFKSVNDERGHQAGDAALRAVATALDGARAGDRAFRLGGDEFALIVPDADVHETGPLVERVREAARVEAGVTLSIGVAVTRHAVDAHELWRRADRALYRAKRTGRDAAVLADVPAA